MIGYASLQCSISKRFHTPSQGKYFSRLGIFFSWLHQFIPGHFILSQYTEGLFLKTNMADGDTEVTFNPQTGKVRMSEIGLEDSINLSVEETLEGNHEQRSGGGESEAAVGHTHDSNVSLMSQTGQDVSYSPPKMVLKPDKYEGKGDLEEYLSHFQDCAELGAWDSRSKCLLLAANLRGAARKYYDGLRSEEKKDYATLLAALRRRFGGRHLLDSWLTKLETRRRKAGEPISDVGDDIWKMTQRAYHDFDLRSQEQLALKHFYRIINAEMKVKCVENHCTNIYEAVTVVERYEALYEDGREMRKSHVRAIDSSDSKQLTVQLEEIKKQLKALQMPSTNRNVTCFQCGEPGHYKSECPSAPQKRGVVCFGCGQPGHYRRECRQQNSYQARSQGNGSLSN